MPPRNPVESELIADLRRGGNLPGTAEAAEFTSTHASLVFLTPTEVFKVKRARDFGFLDYSTPEKRRHFCEEEVRLNRRAAPGVYLGVLPVYHDDQGYSLTRAGEVVDHAVHMVRLPDAASALAMLREQRLGPQQLRQVARCAAAFYRAAEVHAPDDGDLETSIEENFEQLEPYRARFVDSDRLDRIARLQRRWLAVHRAELASRVRRDGHGDLRLEHVYLLDDGPVLIDCIEFLDRFRIADPELDAAFLAMDLWWRGRRDLADFFAAEFAAALGDRVSPELTAGYISYRATVRAKVACFVAADPSTDARAAERKAAEAASLFALAESALSEQP